MKKTVLLFALLAIAGALYSASEYRLFSLFQIISSVPLILVLISPAPATIIICTFILFELYTTLPHGSMVLMFGIPYAMLFLWKTLRAEFSWKFLFGVVLIITLQNAALLSIVAFMNPPAAFQIPWNILSMQIIATSLGTFVLSFVYHEYSARL